MSRIQNKNLDIYQGSTNLSNTLSVFKGIKAITLGPANFLYLGYPKPIHSLYIDVDKANTVDTLFVIEKWNGITWEIVDRQDETFGIKKSGHLLTDDYADEIKQTMHDKNQFWFRLSTMDTTSSIDIRYINLVFTCLEDLIAEEPDIELFYPVDPATSLEIKSFLPSFISSRDEVLNRLNQQGKYKYNGIEVSLLNQWDIYNINELRPFCKNYSLHKIYNSIIDNKESSTKDKASYYLDKANNSFDIFKSILTLDQDDNGKLEQDEIKASEPTSYRLNR